MSVTIQDDMWCSAQAMQGRQGDDLLLALIRYGFTGEEPSKGSRIFPAFLLCKGRIDMSADKSSKARRMAEARWGKHDAQDAPVHDATAYDKHNAQACSSIMLEHDTEVSRGEVSRGEVRGDEYESAHASMLSAQVEEIIACLNEAAGTQYKPSTPKTRTLIQARLNEGFTVDDFKTVIDNMASRWGNDSDMRQYLRPQTLFGTKFESYLQGGAVKSNDYSMYD